MNRYRFDSANHIHLLDNNPLLGTSTVVGVLSKPLVWWASGKALEPFGWTPTKTDKSIRLETAVDKLYILRGFSDKEYLEYLDKAYRNHKNSLDKSAVKGKDLHSEIETYVKSKINKDKNQPYSDTIEPFIKWADDNVEQFLWSEAHCYSESLGCGGITDIGAKLKDGKVYIIDIKSSREAYTSHYLQCAGYSLQLKTSGLLTSEGDKIGEVPKIDGIIIMPFGSDYLEPAFNKTPIDVYEDAFKAAVVLHRLVCKEDNYK